MFVFKAAVVGAGTMGGEIAQAIASSDIPVVLKDIDQKFVDHGLEKAREVTKGQLDRLVAKEKLTQEQADARLEEVIGLIEGTTTYDCFGDVDFVIEAAPEKMEIKQAVFAELDEVTPGHAILASNTSSLSISEMGEATLRPDKVVGFHFFYPASVMPLVEIIEGDETDPEVVQAAYNFAQAIRKQPITCGEVPGFVVNRILNSAVGEIWRAQEEQGLSIKKIDEAVAAANVAPMGPFFLVDLLGLDTVLHVAEHLRESYGDSLLRPRGDAEAGRRRATRRQVRRRRLLQGRRAAGRGRRRPRRRGARRADEAEGDRRGLPGARGGRLHRPRHRPRDDGRRRHGPAPRASSRRSWAPTSPASTTSSRSSSGPQNEHGERFAPPRILKRLVAQGRLGQKSGPGLLRLPAARRGRADRDGQARDPRRRRDRLARRTRR